MKCDGSKLLNLSEGCVHSKSNSIVVCWSGHIHHPHPSTISYESKHLKDSIIIRFKNCRPGWVSCGLPTVPHVDPAPRFDHVPVLKNILNCHCRHVQCRSSNLLEGNNNNQMEFSESFQKYFSSHTYICSYMIICIGRKIFLKNLAKCTYTAPKVKIFDLGCP